MLRDAGESSWSFSSLLNYGIDGVLSFNHKPLRVVFHIGAASLVLGLLYLIRLIVDWVRDGVETPGYLTTFAALTLFSGVQLISLAVIAEYIGRIYLEVKGRPHYVIAESLNDPGTSTARPAIIEAHPEFEDSLRLSREAVVKGEPE